MKVEDDVKIVADQYGVPAELMQAVVDAEGNIVKAVQCSVRNVKTRSEALRVLARSLIHRSFEFLYQNNLERDYVKFFGGKWAPLGAENDPRNLNANFVPNVTKLWLDQIDRT